MFKLGYFKVIFIASVSFVLVGLIIAVYMQVSFRNENIINVYLKDGETETVQFEDLAMIPGDSLEYVIKLKSNDIDIDKGKITLKFAEISNTDTISLKDFACVKILIEDRVICDELLSTRFNGDDIVLPFDFKENKNTEIKVVYYMPIEVGNEAKNAEAIFELLLTANND